MNCKERVTSKQENQPLLGSEKVELFEIMIIPLSSPVYEESRS